MTTDGHVSTERISEFLLGSNPDVRPWLSANDVLDVGVYFLERFTCHSCCEYTTDSC